MPLSAVFLGIGAFVAALIVIPLAQRVAVLNNVTSMPRADRLHDTPTPYLGGVPIVLVAAAASPFIGEWQLEAAVIIGGALLLGVVGLLDDLRNLRPAPRLVAEAGAALAAVAAGAHVQLFGGVVDVVLTVVWFVGVTNAFNLVDNMDGAAGGIAAATALALLITAGLNHQVLVSGMAAVVAGTCLAFLIYNWHPARIFMGDAGALPLGYLLAAIALKLRFPVAHEASIAAVVLFTAPALFDTTLVVISRIARHRPIYVGGTDHTSHRLLRLGLPTRVVASLITLVAAACGGLGVAVGRGALDPVPVIVPLTLVAAAGLVALLRLPAEAPVPTNSYGAPSHRD
ncbi:MAG TPA: MraY family glycosyltransferase [Acidimicrobiales bacterium]|nr:MraY family glycosyltransferase [Acidimicrobiales bacterium]